MAEHYLENDREKFRRLLLLTKRLIHSGSNQQLYIFFERYHVADIADALSSCNHKEQLIFFKRLNPELAVEVLENMMLQDQISLIQEFKTQQAAQYIENMDPDDAADLLEELLIESGDTAHTIFSALSEEDAADIKKLLSYQADSAGSIMNSEFVWIPEKLTIEKALEIYRSQNPINTEASFYLFIINSSRQLVGYTNLRTLILSDPKATVQSVRDDFPVKINVKTDQEEVARIIQKYDVIMVPVVDDDDHLLGVITVDDIVDVVVEEATEDIYRITGTADIQEAKLLFGSKISAIVTRFPWLFMTIIGGLISSIIISVYSTHFNEQFFSLAVSLSFVPLLMGLGGNVGNQSATIIIRGISTGKIRKKTPLYFILRETMVAASIGIILASSVWLTLMIAGQSLLISMIVALSIFLNCTVAASIGTLLPFLFQSLKIDPAIASAPFISSSLDIIGQIVYFTLTLYIFHSFL